MLVFIKPTHQTETWGCSPPPTSNLHPETIKHLIILAYIITFSHLLRIQNKTLKRT